MSETKGLARVLRVEHFAAELQTQVLVIGAGASGITAALAASDEGAEVLVVDRDERTGGSTALSSGFVPAAPTHYQKALDIDDSAARFAADLAAKTGGLGDADLIRLAATESGKVIEWLARQHGIEWMLIDDFLYPGHSRLRMHAVPEKTGSALHSRLQASLPDDVPVVTGARATRLLLQSDRLVGVDVQRIDGAMERIGCEALILACNGYGGNPQLVSELVPEMRDALYFGHAGNQGDAVLWGRELGALLNHLSGYQGHASVASPGDVLITWAIMSAGGLQVNLNGRRFANELRGYSEQAREVLAQPGGIAWNVYDQRIHEFALSFDDYHRANTLGVVKRAADVEELAHIVGAPVDELRNTFAQIDACREGATDALGRDFSGDAELRAPLFCVRVRGALFHTQGGLVIDHTARVRHDKGVFENLYAGGGAACGVSGPAAEGYLSGNGLLTAFTFGAIAGRHAARNT